MSDLYKDDPWVLKHKQLKKEDQDYRKYLWKYRIKVSAKIGDYSPRSSFIAIGALLIFLGFVAAGIHLYVIQTDVDYNVVDAILGVLGSDLQWEVLDRGAASFFVLMPLGIVIGSILFTLGVRGDMRTKRLIFCTWMVEGYLAGADPTEMKRPKRYDPSWL